MKRSSLKRKTELRQGAPLQARKPLSSTKPASTRRKRAKRQSASDKRWRSPKYLAWVRSLPCAVCGAQANAAHHLIGMFNVSGMGLKAPDSLAMPVCDGPGDTCHRKIHNERDLRARQPGFLRHTISLGARHFDGEIREELRRAWRFIDEREAIWAKPSKA